MSEDGIIVPGSADVRSTLFQNALQKAVALFPYIRANEWFFEYGSRELGVTFENEYARLVIEADEQLLIFVHEESLSRARAILVNEAIQADKRRMRERQQKNGSKPGYVYLIRAESGYFKIGRTVNPDDRMKTFGVKLPFEVKFECVVNAENMIQLERDLHERFADKRINGEWFNLNDADVEYIKGLAS